MKKLIIILIVIGILIGVIIITKMCPEITTSKSILNIYNWSYYIGKNTISDFEIKFNCKINYDNYSSNEEMIAKIKAGGKYDIVFPSDYSVSLMISANLLLKLDHTKIQNLKYIDKRFLDLSFDRGNQYSIPYHWGSCGIGYNKQYIVQVPTRFDMLWDEKYNGKITVLDDTRFTIGMALKNLGYSANTINTTEIEKATEKLILLKNNLRAFSSDTYIKMLATGEIWLAYGYSPGVLQAATENKNVEYIIPNEGTVLYVDNIAITRHCREIELAHKFLNYLLQPEVIAQISNEIGGANPNLESYKYLEPEILNNKQIYPPDEIINKSEFLKDLGKDNDLYTKAWERIKIY